MSPPPFDYEDETPDPGCSGCLLFGALAVLSVLSVGWALWQIADALL